MSLSEGAFSSAVYAEGLDDLDDILAVDAARDLSGSAFTDLDSDAFVDEVDGIMDMIVGRQQDFQMDQPPLQSGADPEPEQAQQPNDPIQEAITAMAEARSMQGETVKLKAGEITAASGQGASSVNDYARAKGAAAENAQEAIAAVRKEVRGAEASAKQDGPAPSGGGVGGAVGSAAATTVVAAAAKVVFPAAGATIDLAGHGSMVTANMPTRSFRSAAEGGYGASEGTHQSYDVMSGRTTVQPTTSGNIGSRYAEDSPLSMGEIRYGVEASLEDMRLGMMSEEGLSAIEADLAEMKADADLGAAMYQRWATTGISTGEAAAEMPVAALDLDEAEQAALVMDNPNLEQEAPNPMKLGLA